MENQVTAGVNEGVVLFSFSETANFKTAMPIRNFMNGQKDYVDVIFDLRKTKLIDSSCIGALLSIGLPLFNRAGKKGRIWAAEPLLKTLSTYGLDDIFDFSLNGSDTAAWHLIDLPSDTSSTAETLKLMISNHEFLSSLSPENRKLFEDLIRGLRSELAKEENGAG